MLDLTLEACTISEFIPKNSATETVVYYTGDDQMTVSLVNDFELISNGGCGSRYTNYMTITHTLIIDPDCNGFVTLNDAAGMFEIYSAAVLLTSEVSCNVRQMNSIQIEPDQG